jgi:glutathionylspermidine synthase
MVAHQGQLVLMVDNRLLEIGRPTARELKRKDLAWFIEGENEDYIAPEVLRLSEAEMEHFRKDANEVYDLMVEAAKYVGSHELWEEAGIPAVAVELVAHSLRHELGSHLIGRFDYAGGLGEQPLKLLEFNADTFSLLPESTHVQRLQFDRLARKQRKQSGQFNLATQGLIRGFQQLLDQNPEMSASLLVSGLGHPEDWLNLDIIREAARSAGFEDVQEAALDKVIFSPEEGLFIELGNGEYQRFDFWFKMIPWDFIAYEEPELMSTLTSIVKQKHAVVINPAYSMLLQSKGLLPFLSKQFAYHPSVLKSSHDKATFGSSAHVEKPIYGRTGDNVKIFLYGKGAAVAANAGDYGHLPSIYQALAEFEKDEDGDIYQPSVFWAGGSACGFCLRRQDSLIVDDDAEFVGHILQEGPW